MTSLIFLNVGFPIIRIGTLTFRETRVLIQIEDEPIFKFDPPAIEGEPFYLVPL